MSCVGFMLNVLRAFFLCLWFCGMVHLLVLDSVGRKVGNLCVCVGTRSFYVGWEGQGIAIRYLLYTHHFHNLCAKPLTSLGGCSICVVFGWVGGGKVKFDAGFGINAKFACVCDGGMRVVVVVAVVREVYFVGSDAKSCTRIAHRVTGRVACRMSPL